MEKRLCSLFRKKILALLSQFISVQLFGQNASRTETSNSKINIWTPYFLYLSNNVSFIGIKYCISRSILNSKRPKFYVLLCSILLCSIGSSAQNAAYQNEKIARFCKIWGFLKYNHPNVAAGKFDWDSEFIKGIEKVSTLLTPQMENDFYLSFIGHLGKVPQCSKCNTIFPDSLKVNLSNIWLQERTQFSDSLIKVLLFIEQNHFQGKSYYVGQQPAGQAYFRHEKVYKDSIFPNSGLRLLGLARFWNIICYFYPYKNLIGTDWEQVLVKMIPEFNEARDITSYHLALLKLVASINDSHTDIRTIQTEWYFGLRYAPFKYKIIDNKAVVIGFYNDSLSKKHDILFGDVILSIDGLSVNEVVQSRKPYIGASNEAVITRKMENLLLFQGNSEFFTVVIERNGHQMEKLIRRYYYGEFHYDWYKRDTSKAWKRFDDSIGYINLELLKPKDVNNCMDALQKTKTIIIDVRNYPQGTVFKICNYLLNKPKPFARFLIPNLEFPGILKDGGQSNCGRINNSNYNGHIIILFNEKTQSAAEFACMAFQTFNRTTSIGSQTSGADGNVTLITFPGNYSSYITGIAVYYPDGRATQRIGLVPDITVKPSIQAIQQGRDEVLERAIYFAHTKK